MLVEHKNLILVCFVHFRAGSLSRCDVWNTANSGVLTGMVSVCTVHKAIQRHQTVRPSHSQCWQILYNILRGVVLISEHFLQT